MRNNNPTGSGQPLDDNRLTLADTTPAGQQYYRIWHDGQQILVPAGQSTTRPHVNENVSANTRVHGGIREGWFQSPIVEFRNTTNERLFDRFNLTVWRDIENNGTELDLFDLSIFEMRFILHTEFEGLIWEWPMQIRFYREEPNIYISDTHFYTTHWEPHMLEHSPVHPFTIQLQIEFLINKMRRASIDLGTFNSDNDQLFMDVRQARIQQGASEYLFERTMNENIPTPQFTAFNIVITKGWS